MTTLRLSTLAHLALARRVRAAAATLRAWRCRSRTRSELFRLDTPRLHDIGITEADRRQECSKWFWQI